MLGYCLEFLRRNPIHLKACSFATQLAVSNLDRKWQEMPWSWDSKDIPVQMPEPEAGRLTGGYKA